MHTNAQKALDNIDDAKFNITSNYRMDILKKAMKAKSKKKGYSDCEKLFNLTKVSFSNHVRGFVIKALFDALVIIRNTNASLLRIQGRLSGWPLVDEIHSCQAPKKMCNLTGIYNSTIIDAENFLRANFTIFTAPDVTYRVLPRVVSNKQLIQFLKDIVIDTVNECLNRLK